MTDKASKTWADYYPPFKHHKRKQSDFEIGDRVLVIARFVENGVDNGYFVFAGKVDRVSKGSDELHVVPESDEGIPLWYHPDELMPFEFGKVIA